MNSLAPMYFMLYLALAVLTGTVYSQQLGERGVPRIDDFTRTVVTAPKAAPLNDFLIDLAASADINIIADATNFPADAMGKPYPASSVAADAVKRGVKHWEPTRLNQVADLSNDIPLSWLRYSHSTFLFWSEPDPLSLAPLLTAAKKAETAPLITTPAENITSNNPFRAYFVEVHKWDGKIGEKGITLKVDDLPVNIRNQVLLETRRSLEMNNGIYFNTGMFDADFWNKASLSIRRFYVPSAIFTPGDPGILSPHLVVAAPELKQGQPTSIAESREISLVGRLKPTAGQKAPAEPVVRRRD